MTARAKAIGLIAMSSSRQEKERLRRALATSGPYGSFLSIVRPYAASIWSRGETKRDLGA